MSICKLIYQELESLNSGEVVDVKALDPGKYDILIGKLRGDIVRLKLLELISKLTPESLVRIDSFLKEQKIDVTKSKLEELFANSAEEINDKTVFFEGVLDYAMYEKINPNAKSLPESLQIIYGNLSVENVNITSIDLEQVTGEIYVTNCSKLTNANIKSAYNFSFITCTNLAHVSIDHASRNVEIKGCPNLSTVVVGNCKSKFAIMNCRGSKAITLGEVGGDIILESSQDITIEKIFSILGKHEKIAIGGRLFLSGSGLEDTQDSEIQTKFNIISEKIRRT